MYPNLPPIAPQGLPASPPTISRPAPSSGPSNPFIGSTGSGGSKAPSLDGPYSGRGSVTPSRMPSPTAPLAVSGGGSIINPYVAIPLAVWGGLFENPGPAGLTPEKEARELKPGFGRGFFPQSPKPANPLRPQNPANPSNPNPLKPKPAPKGDYNRSYRVLASAERKPVSPVFFNINPLIRGAYGGLETRRIDPGYTTYGIQTGMGEGRRGSFFPLIAIQDVEASLWFVTFNGAQATDGPIVTPPPNPGGSGTPPPGVNPYQKSPTNPNPDNTGQAPPATNPGQKSPTNPNPDKITQPPNPARVGQAPPATNPGQKNPTNPNPSRPRLPGPIIPAAPNPGNVTTLPDATNPYQKNPTNPNPGALVPQIPGALVPQIPGALVPTSPNPLNPIKKPGPDPCASNPCLSSLSQSLKLETIRVKEFIGCYKILGVKKYFRDAFVSVPAGSSYAWTLCLNNQADLLAQSCDETGSDCLAVVPDWWQVRLGADRPQLLVSYAAKFADGTWDKAKYVISVPHWSRSKLLTLSTDFPIYRKGQYQGVMILPDNSKLIVNAYTSAAAFAAIDKFALGIPSAMISRAVTKVASRRGRDLLSIVVYPRSARYFATGQMDLSPTWVNKF